MAETISIKIMGILNVTPDSFSDGGMFLDPRKACARAEQMVEEGADILDIGGESSRPGSDPVPLQEELDRVLPVLEWAVRLGVPVSIDTTKAAVAKEALALGAQIVNDISGLRFEPGIAELVARHHARLIIMHMRGVPKTMQEDLAPGDIMEELLQFFQEQTETAIRSGVDRKNIILDPGIGFGKRLEENIDILKNLSILVNLGFPVMIGASRKSMIGHITEAPVGDRLPGSLAIACLAAVRGAGIIRVHDVAATAQAINVLRRIW